MKTALQFPQLSAVALAVAALVAHAQAAAQETSPAPAPSGDVQKEIQQVVVTGTASASVLGAGCAAGVTARAYRGDESHGRRPRACRFHSSPGPSMPKQTPGRWRTPVLARALDGAVKVGATIPEPLYRAVAALIAWAYEVKAEPARAPELYLPDDAIPSEFRPETKSRSQDRPQSA